MNNAITRINCYLRKSNSLLRKEWTQTMHARIYGIVLGDKSSSHLEFWQDMQVVVCLCAQIFSGTPLVWHFIEYQRQEYVCLLRNANLKLNIDNTRICILLVFLEVKSSQAHLPSASHFHVSNSTLRFGILSCFNPAATLYFAFRQVCLHSRPPK